MSGVGSGILLFGQLNNKNQYVSHGGTEYTEKKLQDNPSFRGAGMDRHDNNAANKNLLLFTTHSSLDSGLIRDIKYTASGPYGPTPRREFALLKALLPNKFECTLKMKVGITQRMKKEDYVPETQLDKTTIWIITRSSIRNTVFWFKA